MRCGIHSHIIKMEGGGGFFSRNEDALSAVMDGNDVKRKKKNDDASFFRWRGVHFLWILGILRRSPVFDTTGENKKGGTLGGGKYENSIAWLVG